MDIWFLENRQSQNGIEHLLLLKSIGDVRGWAITKNLILAHSILIIPIKRNWPPDLVPKLPTHRNVLLIKYFITCAYSIPITVSTEIQCQPRIMNTGASTLTKITNYSIVYATIRRESLALTTFMPWQLL